MGSPRPEQATLRLSGPSGSIATRRRRRRRWLPRVFHSLRAKALVAAIVFLLVPLLVYEQFRAADRQQQQMLLRSLENEGRVIGELLRPQFESYAGDGSGLRAISETLRRVRVIDGHRIKLLLRPSDAGATGRFFFIAHAPAVSEAYLREARAELARDGVLRELRDDCAAESRPERRYVDVSGTRELLTSVTPIATEAGCWAVITSHSAEDALGEALGRPLWETPEARLAAAIYVGMALLVVLLALGVWRSLRRFAAAARTIRARGPSYDGPSFRELNSIPEMESVAADFDRMVETLRDAAWVIRRAAEDSAHALKTPLGTMWQCLEPLRQGVRAEQPRERRAVELMERSLVRLDHLVEASQRIEAATADILEAPSERLDFSAFVAATLAHYEDRAAARGITLLRDLQLGVSVIGAPTLLTTVVECLIDNALDFAPDGSAIELHVGRAGETTVLQVADTGPGVEPDRLEQIFERYFSTRAAQGHGSDPTDGEGRAEAPPGRSHFGIGLWLVRRNVAAMGGTVHAEPNIPHGLRVVVQLPRA